MAAIPIVIPPPQLFALPVGTYGVSFDLTPHAMIEDLPNEWNLKGTSRIHEKIAQHFVGRLYSNPQGSVFLRKKYCALLVFMDIMSLRELLPPDDFATVARACQISHIQPIIMDITDDIRLGVQYSPALLGPTPASLVPDTVPHALMDHAPDPLPLDVQPSHAATIGNNWALWRVIFYTLR
ncbi:hypothetical protein WOLCODRAFT_20618 [Wolfiporia cocos MD-104 SS10]|uniref:Uncharacterized protein n=1 Tax=Wolfiporia cocos (strain MD-104) TaxID=742152 RepID=A0A2H3JCX2_WOLCO|nr:hypothetical protein WOLCODRAFT_20618 [Wolfiporia cocos MD-104 SS10]